MIARQALVVALVLATSGAAGAHPLGNFTINRYAALRVEAATVAVQYVLDMAEIPAFQEIRDADVDRDGSLGPAERDAYLARAPTMLAQGLRIALDDQPLTLRIDASRLELPPGAGGLPTLRLEMEIMAVLPRVGGTLTFRDGNFADRVGWREIVGRAGEGVILRESTVPERDRSHALRAYPSDPLAPPAQMSEARLRLAPGTGASRAPEEALPVTSSARPADALADLVTSRAPLTPLVVLLSLLVAASLGALHALTPGHGKTVVGAYLVGARGTARHALVLGLVVTVTHTIGVYVIGLTTLAASAYVLPERLFLWVSMASGLLVVGIGASLATARLRATLGLAHVHGHGHGHGHAHHGHPQAHEHGHRDHSHLHDHGDAHGHGARHHGWRFARGEGADHAHAHLPPGAGEASLSWGSLLALGVSGGLLPCPSALVVMLGAISVGRVGFGLLLIVAFSTGLAAVLTGIGLALVYSRDLFNRLPLDGHLAGLVPIASAVVIMVAGLAMVAQALAQAGMLHLRV